MEIVKISETEVKVIDNQNSYKIFTKEELEQKITELTSKQSNLLARKASKVALFDTELAPVNAELIGYNSLLGILETGEIASE
jgi:hypothetical protein